MIKLRRLKSVNSGKDISDSIRDILGNYIFPKYIGHLNVPKTREMLLADLTKVIGGFDAVQNIICDHTNNPNDDTLNDLTVTVKLCYSISVTDIQNQTGEKNIETYVYYSYADVAKDNNLLKEKMKEFKYHFMNVRLISDRENLEHNLDNIKLLFQKFIETNHEEGNGIVENGKVHDKKWSFVHKPEPYIQCKYCTVVSTEGMNDIQHLDSCIMTEINEVSKAIKNYEDFNERFYLIFSNTRSNQLVDVINRCYDILIKEDSSYEEQFNETVQEMSIFCQKKEIEIYHI